MRGGECAEAGGVSAKARIGISVERVSCCEIPVACRCRRGEVSSDALRAGAPVCSPSLLVSHGFTNLLFGTAKIHVCVHVHRCIYMFFANRLPSSSLLAIGPSSSDDVCSPTERLDVKIPAVEGSRPWLSWSDQARFVGASQLLCDSLTFPRSVV